MLTPTLSIITATKGRPTLARTLASIAPQLENGDEMLIARRDTPWGNRTRDELIPKASGTHLWWMDDDDIATPNALHTIRQAVTQDPGTIHIFRMQYHDRDLTLWRRPEFALYNISTQMCVVPNMPGRLGRWHHTGAYPGSQKSECGDWHFMDETARRLGQRPTFHDNIIAHVRLPA